MTSFKTLQDVAQGQQNIEHRKRVRAAIEEIYRAYPDLKRCDATENLIERLCSEFAGEAVVPELWLFRETVKANPYVMTRQELKGVTVPAARQRESLINQIAELLLAPNGVPRGGEFDINERHKMASWTKEQLEARLAQVRLSQNLSQHTSQEIREGLKALRPQPGQREPLPSEWTRERLLASSSHCIKFLNQKFGQDAVNARLQGRG